ncbi:hypothetical protein DQT32_03525 [Salmonella enterica subsp. enterica serovar Braenderup]|nr:hypothetical protein [Salmonella enterica subsp. enterica serovar Braenderup]
MNPDFIFLKKEILFNIIHELNEYLDAANTKAQEAWDNNDSHGFFDVWQPMSNKLKKAINELEYAINNLHTQEGIEIYNKYMQGQEQFTTVFEVLDRDDAYMDEKYGEE